MNRAEERLTAALRSLAAASRQDAPPEVAAALKDAFRRHHARRRRIQWVRFALCAICLAALAALPLLKKSATINTGLPSATPSIPPAVTNPPAGAEVSTPPPPAVVRSVMNRTTRAPHSGFVRLPAFDMLPAGDQLRVVRLQMRGEDLRLVGAPVTEEIAHGRVTADFVVGHDGTPYAVRLVQANF